MIFIGIKRKTLGLIILVIILCLVAVTIYSTVRIAENENRYESTLAIVRMFEDTHFIAYISDVKAQKEKQSIEVFDIGKGQVIIRVPSSADIQNEVFNYVNSIKSLYTKVAPFPQKGYVIRVPFDPPMATKVKPLNDVGIKTLDQVFIIVSEKEAPILLVLDNQRKPYFFTFNASVQPLLDYVKLKPEESTFDEEENAESPTDLENGETEEEPADLEQEDENPEAPTDLELEDVPQG